MKLRHIIHVFCQHEPRRIAGTTIGNIHTIWFCPKCGKYNLFNNYKKHWEGKWSRTDWVCYFNRWMSI